MRRFIQLVPVALAAAGGSIAAAGTVQLSYDQPTLDRWNYGFNGSPGTRELASTFGNVRDNPFYEDFDNRDGQVIVGFDTLGDIPPGLGTGSYEIVSAVLTIMCQCDVALPYDDTPDPFEAYLPTGDPGFADDPDPGAPFELFGVGYRNGLNVFAWQEATPFAFGSPIGLGVRNAFALGFDDEGGTLDVSNSVRERYDATPWAVGQIPSLTPGDTIPPDTDMVMTIDVANESIQAYLRSGLDAGRLRFTITSLTDVGEQSSDVPNFYMRESPLVGAGVVPAARLVLEVVVGNPADVDGNGVVDVDDLVAVILAWGPCPDPPASCPADIDGNGNVDVDDLIAVILNWTG